MSFELGEGVLGEGGAGEGGAGEGVEGKGRGGGAKSRVQASEGNAKIGSRFQTARGEKRNRT